MRRPGFALAGLSLATLLASLGTSIANVALPTLARAFDASFAQTQWVVVGYLLATTAMVVAAGRIGDLTGRRRLLAAGIGLFTVASAAAGVAPTLETLIAARVAQGFGAATMLALAMALVGETLPRERTGRAMGLLGTMSAVGTAAGPTLGGLLIAGLGWRAIFLVTVPLGAVAAGLVLRHVPAAPAAPADPRAHGTLRLALALRGGLAANTLVATVMMTTLVVGPFYLSGALGLGAAAVGLVMSSGPLVAALSGIPAGRFADRVGARRASVAGLAGLGAGAAGLGTLPAGLGVAGYAVPLVVMTAGYATFQTANNTRLMTAVGAGERGVTSGMLNLSRNVGLVAGASLMGTVFAMAAGADVTAASPGSVAAGMHVAFLVALALIVAALAITIHHAVRPWPRRTRRPWRQPDARSASRAPAG